MSRAESRPVLQAAGGFFLLGLAVYGLGLLLHAESPLEQSRWPYFVYYAHALLQGQLHFAEAPPAMLDLARFEGRLYMHHPPFPAALLAPLVAVFGLELSDRLMSVLLGSLNGASFYA